MRQHEREIVRNVGQRVGEINKSPSLSLSVARGVKVLGLYNPSSSPSHPRLAFLRVVSFQGTRGLIFQPDWPFEKNGSTRNERVLRKGLDIRRIDCERYIEDL